MQAKAIQKYERTSPRKLREVARAVRGLDPQSALSILPHLNKRAARVFWKSLRAAMSNAEKKGMDVANLHFSEVQINEGPRLKRFKAGARGMAKPYQRKMSHIRIVLEEKEKKTEKK